ncbi:Partitioning defective 6 beta [Sparganum proliferum]
MEASLTTSMTVLILIARPPDFQILVVDILCMSASFIKLIFNRIGPAILKSLLNEHHFGSRGSDVISYCSSMSPLDVKSKYVDPKENALLPINNDKNCERESYGELRGYKAPNTVFLRKKPAELVRSIGSEKPKPGHQSIMLLDDFHKVSSIIDDGTVPECMRRVHLIRTGSKPLGFYIRDGFSIRTTPSGVEQVPGVFISRLIPGGLAESTGLLAVKDEIIEVNGIEVYGKSLDQVTDMMIANSSNLIITVKPINQKTCIRRAAPSTSTLSNPGSASSLRMAGDTADNGPTKSNSPADSMSGKSSGSLRGTTAHSSRSSHRMPQSRSSNELPGSVAEEPGVIDI